ISVAPSVSPFSVHQCLPVHNNATYQCPSELHFSATYQCHQCRLSVPSVPPNSAAYQCHVCTSVMPVNAHQ
ncbi:unnamed protein product, partial [Staurois parvus]